MKARLTITATITREVDVPDNAADEIILAKFGMETFGAPLRDIYDLTCVADTSETVIDVDSCVSDVAIVNVFTSEAPIDAEDAPLPPDA